MDIEKKVNKTSYPSRSKIKCPFCDFTCRADHLRRHIKSKHQHNNKSESPFEEIDISPVKKS